MSRWGSHSATPAPPPRCDGYCAATAPAAAALYGFSPALINSGISHNNLQPPLIIDAALRAVTGKGRPVHNGVWLGILVSAQLFIEEEVLTDAVIACVVVIVVLAAGHRMFRGSICVNLW